MSNENDFEVFDFVVNDEDEVLLLLYQRDGAPENPKITLYPDDNSAVLHRNDNDEIVLNDIGDDIFDSLADADKLLICEITRSEKEEDTQIVNAYEAEICD